MQKQKYGWGEYLKLRTSEEKRAWIKRRIAFKKRMRNRRLAEKYAAKLEAIEPCKHLSTTVITPDAEEDRGLALDVIREERCDDCNHLVRLIA